MKALASFLVVVSLTAPALAQQGPAEARHGIDATMYVGISIDTFSARELRRYLNPEESGDRRQRFVAGFNFDYRVAGRDDDRGGQLWLYGETVHGVRSADVNCGADPGIPVCAPFAVGADARKVLFILRNASSLEAFAGARWELMDVNFGEGAAPGSNAVKAYVKGQVGFLAVEQSGGDALNINHVALGLRAVRGRYRDSYFEAGFGTSDLYDVHSDSRLKIDGMLNIDVGLAGAFPFVQMVVDADGRSGADTIQTYIGVSLDLDNVRGWFTPR
ncbi:MAG: hypothetical protein GEU82_13620 [Luteitalea sp.]|nr:hypothetical protein [Luteitalea sp.]